jgi:hypothetical protein
VSNILSAADPDKLTGALTTISEGGTVFDVKLIERLGRIRQANPSTSGSHLRRYFGKT